MPTSDRPQPETYERQLQITEQLARLEEKMSAYSDKSQTTGDLLMSRLGQVETKLEKIEQKLVDDSVNVVLRLDRLEQTEARRNKLTWTAITASITAFIVAGVRLLTGGPH